MTATKEVTLLAWNVKDGLSDPARANAIADIVIDINPDIALFSEGAAEGIPVVSSARQKLESHAGRIFQADYDDTDGRLDRHRLVAVAKPEMGRPSVLPVYGRNAFFFVNGMLPVAIAGLHGLDRDQADTQRSDEARVRQIEHVLSRLAVHEEVWGEDMQSIVMGDLNSMYASSLESRIFRTGAPLFSLLPAKNPGEAQNSIERLGSISQRLGKMAIGGPLQLLLERGYEDSNPGHQGTMRVGPVEVQLDHIMAKNIMLRGHERVNHEGLSDHFGIVATAGISVGIEESDA